MTNFLEQGCRHLTDDDAAVDVMVFSITDAGGETIIGSHSRNVRAQKLSRDDAIFLTLLQSLLKQFVLGYNNYQSAVLPKAKDFEEKSKSQRRGTCIKTLIN